MLFDYSYIVGLKTNNMIFQKLILIISLFIFSLVFCQSDEWQYAGSSTSGNKYFFRNVEVDNYGYYKVWVKTQFKNKTVKGKSINQGYTVELWQIDCKDKKFKILAYADYDYKGNTKKSGNLYDDYTYTLPDSMADHIRSLICNE